MRMIATFGLAVVVLSSFPAGAEVRNPKDVEKMLRNNGLTPRSRPSWEEKFAIRVSGTEQKPEMVNVSCHTRQARRLTVQGKRFTYAADNRGEWGGELEVREGGGMPRPIVQGNVQALIPIEHDLYVFTGLSHIGVDYGAVHVIENYDTKPQPRLLTQLPESLDVVAFDLNWRGFLIVSTLTVSVVDLRGGLHMVMARHAFLPRPNSFLSIGYADILVGVCGGVAWIHAPWPLNPAPDPAEVHDIPLVTYWTRQ